MKLYKLDRLVLSHIKDNGGKPLPSRHLRKNLANCVSTSEITKSINKLIEMDKIMVLENEPNNEINGVSYKTKEIKK